MSYSIKKSVKFSPVIWVGPIIIFMVLIWLGFQKRGIPKSSKNRECIQHSQRSQHILYKIKISQYKTLSGCHNLDIVYSREVIHMVRTQNISKNDYFSPPDTGSRGYVTSIRKEKFLGKIWGRTKWMIVEQSLYLKSYTAQKMKFSIKDFFSKYDQIRCFLRIWSYLLKKSLMENFIFCVVLKYRQKSVIELYCEISYQLNVKKMQITIFAKNLHHRVLTLFRMNRFLAAHVCGESKPCLAAIIHIP